MPSRRSFTDRMWKDPDGKQAIAQTPNLPLVTWIASRILCTWVFRTGHLERLFSAVAFGALFTWAWLELFKGSSYFRRLLGFATLGALLVAKSR